MQGDGHQIVKRGELASRLCQFTPQVLAQPIGYLFVPFVFDGMNQLAHFALAMEIVEGESALKGKILSQGGEQRIVRQFLITRVRQVTQSVEAQVLFPFRQRSSAKPAMGRKEKME